jgi:hypothetical protein
MEEKVIFLRGILSKRPVKFHSPYDRISVFYSNLSHAISLPIDCTVLELPN